MTGLILLYRYFKFHNPPYPYYEGTGNFNNLGANGGLHNRLGRAYPDVAANGNNIAVFVEGQFFLLAGTSASTPIFASIINLVSILDRGSWMQRLGLLPLRLTRNVLRLEKALWGSSTQSCIPTLGS